MLTINTADLESVGGKRGNVRAAEVRDEAGKAYIVIVIDPTVNLGPSTSGKMIAVANSGGFQDVAGDLVGNFYVGRRA